MPTQPSVTEIGTDDIPVIPAGVDKDQAKALLESARAGFARVHANTPAKNIKPIARIVPAAERPRFPKPSITHRLETFFPVRRDDGDS